MTNESLAQSTAESSVSDTTNVSPFTKHILRLDGLHIIRCACGRRQLVRRSYRQCATCNPRVKTRPRGAVEQRHTIPRVSLEPPPSRKIENVRVEDRSEVFADALLYVRRLLSSHPSACMTEIALVILRYVLLPLSMRDIHAAYMMAIDGAPFPYSLARSEASLHRLLDRGKAMRVARGLWIATSNIALPQVATGGRIR